MEIKTKDIHEMIDICVGLASHGQKFETKQEAGEWIITLKN